jgi:hypothetical protein
MSDKRIDALKNIISMDYKTKYITLSDNSELGSNLIEDLKKYFILLFKNKYRYNYKIWIKTTIKQEQIYVPKDQRGEEGNKEDEYIYYDLLKHEQDNESEFNNIRKYIEKNMKDDDEEIKSKIEIPDMKYNQDINLKKNYRDKSINLGYVPMITINIEEGSTEPIYYRPLLEDNYTNYDFQEKSRIYDDLNKFDIIFKNTNYKNIDDLVILDFYKEFNNKIDKIKQELIKDDDELKNEIINNLYDKLLLLYEIKTNSIKNFKKTARKTPPDESYCNGISITNDPFDIIRCEIFKRSEISKKLNSLQKGGTGGPTDNTAVINSVDKIFESVNAETDKELREKYLEIDKNILSSIINSDKLTTYIKNKKTNKRIETFSKFAKNIFKINQPKEVNNQTPVTFNDFKGFILNIKNKLVDDSVRYMTIIKYLDIIKDKTDNPQLTGGAGPQQNQVKPVSSTKDNSEFEQNPGKKYLKNFTDIYIILVKEYYKFVKEPEKAKDLIKNITEKEETAEEKDAREKRKKDEDADAIIKSAEEKDREIKKQLGEWENKKTIEDSNKIIDSGERNDKPGKGLSTADAQLKLKQTQQTQKFQDEIAENILQKSGLENRKKELEESIKTVKNALIKLYNECINIQAPFATEYSDYTKAIIKIGKLKLLIDDSDVSNNDIIGAYNEQIISITKEIGAKEQQNKSLEEKKKINNGRFGGRGPTTYKGGEITPEEKAEQEKKIKENMENKDAELNKEKEVLKKLLSDNLNKLIVNTGEPYNLYTFIKYLKDTFGGDDDDNINGNAMSNKYNENDTLFEKIWNEYNDGIKSYSVNNKKQEYLTYINEGEKLKNKILLNELDPEIVLKITFQDKVVFVALMFAIRTILMVIFEFLIEYNLVKSLRYAIIIYAGLYVLLLLLFTAFVNLDSYKLRIVFNYLNMHINTSNLILHIILFIIFSFLVIVIIQTDNFVNNLGDVFDFTYIYNYIYTFNFNNILSGEFENNLSKDEKMKLQYRLDIISTLIFIFSGTLILVI